MTLVHEGLNAEQAAGHAEGWRTSSNGWSASPSTGDAGPDEWKAVPDPMDPIGAAEASLAVLQPVLRGLTADDQPKPTPCADFTCHALAVHVMESIVSVGAMVGAEVRRPETGSLESKVSDMAEQAISAWRARLDGVSTRPRVRAVGPSILAVEFLLHGWDLAQASGQTMVAADPLVDYVRELAEPIVPGGRGTSVRRRGPARVRHGRARAAGGVRRPVPARLTPDHDVPSTRGRSNKRRSTRMSKYLLVYQGKVDPSTQSAPTEESMQRWTSWGDKVGSQLTDFGAPTGPRSRVGGSGDALPITGYTIVEADSLDDARVLCDGHPFLEDAPADFSVDVYELMPM